MATLSIYWTSVSGYILPSCDVRILAENFQDQCSLSSFIGKEQFQWSVESKYALGVMWFYFSTLPKLALKSRATFSTKHKKELNQSDFF